MHEHNELHLMPLILLPHNHTEEKHNAHNLEEKNLALTISANAMFRVQRKIFLTFPFRTLVAIISGFRLLENAFNVSNYNSGVSLRRLISPGAFLENCLMVCSYSDVVSLARCLYAFSNINSQIRGTILLIHALLPFIA